MSDENQPARPFQNAGESTDLGSAPIKRKRGRPSNEERAAREAAGNGAVPIPPDSATSKNKPGRKPKKVVFSGEQKTAMGKQICGLHMVASMAFGIPELVIEQHEGEMLADAIVAVAEEYGLSMSGKTGAAIQLIGTGAMIYLPRFFAMQRRVNTGAVTEDTDNGQHPASVN